MFLIAKLALVTCAVYMLTALTAEAGVLGLNRLMGGGFGYALNYRGGLVIFAVVWLLSFSLAWRVVMVPLGARFLR